MPSDLGAADQAVLFTAEDRQAALLRGQFVHKLFEVLPEMSPESWSQAAKTIAASMIAGVPSAKRPHTKSAILTDQLVQQAISVMTDPRLAALFGPDSLAELSLSGMVGDRIVQGQVDRLMVGEDEVLLADFKTGTPPADEDSIPDRYIRQMAVYADILRQIYPDKALFAGWSGHRQSRFPVLLKQSVRPLCVSFWPPHDIRAVLCEPVNHLDLTCAVPYTASRAV